MMKTTAHVIHVCCFLLWMVVQCQGQEQFTFNRDDFGDPTLACRVVADHLNGPITHIFGLEIYDASDPFNKQLIASIETDGEPQVSMHYNSTVTGFLTKSNGELNLTFSSPDDQMFPAYCCDVTYIDSEGKMVSDMRLARPTRSGDLKTQGDIIKSLAGKVKENAKRVISTIDALTEKQKQFHEEIAPHIVNVTLAA